MAGISKSLNKNICRNCHFFMIKQHVTKDYASKNLAYFLNYRLQESRKDFSFLIGIRNPYDTFGYWMYLSSAN